MSRPISSENGKPVKAIEPESIEPAEDLGSTEAYAGTAIDQEILKSYDSGERKRLLETRLKDLESRADYTEAKVQSERENARGKRLANDEREEQKPLTRRAVQITFWLGVILIILSLSVLGVRTYRIAIQGMNIELGLTPIVLLIVGVTLLFGNRFIPGLLNLVQRK